MKKKILLSLFVIILAISFVGCSTDTVVTVNEDGSFDMTVSYRIDRAAAVNDSALDSLVSIIAQSLASGGIEYTEYSDDNVRGIDAVKHFDSYEEFVTFENWQGFCLTPIFYSETTSATITTKSEDNLLVFSGFLNDAAYQLTQISSQVDVGNNFNGTLTITLPKKAVSNDATKVDKTSYTWEFTSGEEVPVNLVYRQGVSPVLICSIIFLILLICLLILIFTKKKNKKPADEEIIGEATEETEETIEPTEEETEIETVVEEDISSEDQEENSENTEE